jgi:hypothetical protein
MVTGVEAKDPQEVKTYTMDWTSRLQEGATIATSVWAISPSGLTKDSDGILAGNQKTSILLSAGTHGYDYLCLNTITTSDGETLEETGKLRVRTR